MSPAVMSTPWMTTTSGRDESTTLGSRSPKCLAWAAVATGAAVAVNVRTATRVWSQSAGSLSVSTWTMSASLVTSSRQPSPSDWFSAATSSDPPNDRTSTDPLGRRAATERGRTSVSSAVDSRPLRRGTRTSCGAADAAAAVPSRAAAEHAQAANGRRRLMSGASRGVTQLYVGRWGSLSRIYPGTPWAGVKRKQPVAGGASSTRRRPPARPGGPPTGGGSLELAGLPLGGLEVLDLGVDVVDRHLERPDRLGPLDVAVSHRLVL